ncbi:MAG: NAD-dependent protein deacylase [Clostridiaceae bacterium]|nr:NAD-dependent protein deacylase [Clostridiaceae bacterium]
MVNEILKAAELLLKASSIVVLTGAGASTESGIPDFRSSKGLYNRPKKFDYPAEVLLSHSFFVNKTDIFYEYYFSHLIYEDAKPNDCHKALAEMEKLCNLKTIITQNIDGLHQEAGSTRVIELHGTIKRYNCTKCNAQYGLADIDRKAVPKCSKCGGIIKPDVVLYEEPLNEKELIKAAHLTSGADALLVIGTSLVVYPAAGLLNYYKGNKLIIINLGSTPYDKNATVVIRESAGKAMKRIVSVLKENRSGA